MTTFTATIDKIFKNGEWTDREVFLQEEFATLEEADEFVKDNRNYPAIDCIGYGLRVSTLNDEILSETEHIYGITNI